MDKEALLAVSAYVDLNPFFAGICSRPEQGDFTSLKERAEALHEATGIPLPELNSRLRNQPSADLESSIWFTPVEDRPTRNTKGRPRRRGMLPGLKVTDYLQIVDAASRLIRDGKAHLSSQVEPILERLKLQTDHFTQLLRRLQEGPPRGHQLGHPQPSRRDRRSVIGAWI